MKKMIKVYDVKITAGEDAGCFRMIGMADKAEAEKTAAEFAGRYGTKDIVIERETEVVEFADEADMMSWLGGDED